MLLNDLSKSNHFFVITPYLDLGKDSMFSSVNWLLTLG